MKLSNLFATALPSFLTIVSANSTPCEEGPAADPAMTCGEDEFCQLDSGVCLTRSGIHNGICTAMPPMCVLNVDPVCGCDDITYPNDCVAASVGVSVAYEGECPEVVCEVGPEANTEMSCGEDEFCFLESGTCRTKMAVHSGTCQPMPFTCTYDWNPVCSCSGITYANECEAAANGESVAMVGECPQTTCQVAPDIDPTCPSGEFCQLETGSCMTRIAVHNGVCSQVPEICGAIWDPVCGCSGVTYSNECEASAYGDSVAMVGECPQTECEVGPEITNTTCSSDEFCQLDPGSCLTKIAVHSGTCQPLPFMCTADWRPVCSCSGVTYANECEAAANGESVALEGECPDTESDMCEVGPAARSEFSCESGEFCQLDTGACRTKIAVHTGTCHTTPTACTADLNYVCGCDGVTYDNECLSFSNGVNVASDGPCPQTTCEVGPGASPDFSCAQDQFCHVDTGVCRTKLSFHTGTCKATPMACNAILDYVCGCDGVTYDNECDAFANGQSIATVGECPASEVIF